MQTNPERDDSWTMVNTTHGFCYYNDKWVTYQLVTAPTVNLVAGYDSTVVDTLPVLPRFGSRATGFLSNNMSQFVDGEINVDTNGQIRFTTYGTNPLTGYTLPLVRDFVMPR